MGKATRWLRNVLGLKKPDSSSSPRTPDLIREKRRWSFVRTHAREPTVTPVVGGRTGDDLPLGNPVPGPAAVLDQQHASAAEAAEAEDAVAWRDREGEEVAAAIMIQSAFRGYLARRALRALKGLVKIQALVRGHIERKRTVEWLCRMQALLRAQARARADRALLSESSQSSSRSSLFPHPGPATPEKLESSFQAKSFVRDRSPILRKSGSSSRLVGRLGRNGSYSHVDGRLWDQQRSSTRNGCSGEDDKVDKILEIDLGNPRGRNIVRSSCHLDRTSHSLTASKDSLYCEVQSAYPVGEATLFFADRHYRAVIAPGSFVVAFLGVVAFLSINSYYRDIIFGKVYQHVPALRKFVL